MAERGEGSDEGKFDGSEEPSPLGAAEPMVVGPERAAGGRQMPWTARRSRSWKWWLVVAAGIVVLALLPPIVKGFKKTPRNRIGISYGGGPIEGAHYQGIIQPGSNLFFNGLFDSLYLYPSDQQNYIISLQRGVGAQKSPDSIVAPTSDRVQVTYQVAVYFKLNTNILRRFHEQLGLQYKAYTGLGWYNLIRDTFRQQIENALQEETRRLTVNQIFGDSQQLVALQQRVQGKISQNLEGALGARFFCSPDFSAGGLCGEPRFVIKAVGLPASVTNAFNAFRAAQSEADAIRTLGLSPDQYNFYKAISSGKVNFWVLPSGGGITIAGPSTSGGSSGSLPSPPSTTTTSPTSTTTRPAGR